MDEVAINAIRRAASDVLTVFFQHEVGRHFLLLADDSLVTAWELCNSYATQSATPNLGEILDTRRSLRPLSERTSTTVEQVAHQLLIHLTNIANNDPLLASASLDTAIDLYARAYAKQVPAWRLLRRRRAEQACLMLLRSRLANLQLQNGE